MTNPIVARVARAIEDAKAHIGDGEYVDPIILARAAISALTEPSKAMCDAADALENQAWRDKGEREDGRAHWKAMIAVALADDEVPK